LHLHQVDVLTHLPHNYKCDPKEEVDKI
jgi:hypothetical protein